jgi:toxin ParE1/3/4
MNIRFTARSLAQIKSILSFIRNESPQGAAHVASRLDAVINLLQRQPRVGRRTNRDEVRRLLLSPYPYVVFYRLRASDIVILRVVHASRRTAANK